MKIKLILIIIVLFMAFFVSADWIQDQTFAVRVKVLEPFNQTNFNVFLSNETNNFTLNLENYADTNYDVEIYNNNFTILRGNNTLMLNYNITDDFNGNIDIKRL